jgi:extracellular elastinolytic metalloproteinase
MRLVTASLTALMASQILAHPHPRPESSQSSTGLQKRIVNLEAFRLSTVAEYSNSANTTSSDLAVSIVKRDTYVDTATALVKATFPDAEFRLVDDHYVGTNGIGHANFRQTVHGLDIDNADFNVNVRNTQS